MRSIRDRRKGKTMTENDIIAEYVKRKHPEILTSIDFAVFHIGMVCSIFSDGIRAKLKRIDFSRLEEALKKVNEKE